MFDFDFKSQNIKKVAVNDDEAIIEGIFQHRNLTPIEIGVGGEEGQLNLGFRVKISGSNDKVFEGRGVFKQTSVAPGEDVMCVLHIPRQVLEFHKDYVILIDIVVEQKYWWSELGRVPPTLNAMFIEGRPLVLVEKISALEASERLKSAVAAQITSGLSPLLDEIIALKRQVSSISGTVENLVRTWLQIRNEIDILRARGGSTSKDDADGGVLQSTEVSRALGATEVGIQHPRPANVRTIRP